MDEKLISPFWENGITISEFIKLLEQLPQEIKDTYRIGVSEDYYGESFSQGYDLNVSNELLVINPHI